MAHAKAALADREEAAQQAADLVLRAEQRASRAEQGLRLGCGSKIGTPNGTWQVETWTKTCGLWWLNFDPYPLGLRGEGAIG